MNKTKFDVLIQVLLTKDLQQAVQQSVARLDMKLSDYVRQALREKMTRDRQADSIEVPA